MSELGAQAKAMLEAMKSIENDGVGGYEFRNGVITARRAAEYAALSVPEPMPFEAECPDCHGGGHNIKVKSRYEPCPRCHGKGEILVVEVLR